MPEVYKKKKKSKARARRDERKRDCGEGFMVDLPELCKVD